MNIYKTYASQLQSRLAKRAAKITSNEMWEAGYRYLKRYKDVRETKAELKVLRKDQLLDKALLKIVQWEANEFEYQHKKFSGFCGFSEVF